MQNNDGSEQVMDAFIEIDRDVAEYSKITRKYIELAENPGGNIDLSESDLSPMYNEMVAISKIRLLETS